MSLWGQTNLQDANSPIMEEMIMFSDYAMLIVMMIIMLLFYLLVSMLKNKLTDRMLISGQMIEIIWTMIPMVFLIFLAFPSLKLLYMSDEMNNPDISIKVIGHQWYWSYEYMDMGKKMFDSYIIMNSDKMDFFRLLEVDNYLVVPIKFQIRMLISAMDVIHSFTIPVLGVKVDAVPGRINQISMKINRPGVYYGQCSEICGINHSFMPIGLEATSWENFLNWVMKE